MKSIESDSFATGLRQNYVLNLANRIQRFVVPAGLLAGVLIAIAKPVGVVQLNEQEYMTILYDYIGLPFIVIFVLVISLRQTFTVISKGNSLGSVSQLAKNNPAKNSIENVFVGSFVVLCEICFFLGFCFVSSLILIAPFLFLSGKVFSG